MSEIIYVSKPGVAMTMDQIHEAAIQEDKIRDAWKMLRTNVSRSIEAVAKAFQPMVKALAEAFETLRPVLKHLIQDQAKQKRGNPYWEFVRRYNPTRECHSKILSTPQTAIMRSPALRSYKRFPHHRRT